MPYTVVNRVIDSLDVRALEQTAPSSWLKDQISGWRKHRDSWEPGADDLYVTLGDLGEFRVQPDSRPYEFALIHRTLGSVRIWNPDKWATSWPDTGQFYFSFRSVYLQFAGVRAARDVMEQIIEILTVCPLRPSGFRRVSRADLACDTAEPRDMEWGDLQLFVSRSRKVDTFTTPLAGSADSAFKALRDGELVLPPPIDNKGGGKWQRHPADASSGPAALPTEYPEALAAHALLAQFAAHALEHRGSTGQPRVSRVISDTNRPQTVYFGRFGGPLYARRYNKRLSLPVQQKLYMLDVWKANGWDGIAPVWRTEFSLSGDYLKAAVTEDGVLDLRDLDAFLGAIESIWAYLTTRWLWMSPTVTEDRADRHRDRRTYHSLWSATINAFEPALPAGRVQPAPRPVLEQLDAQMLGVATTGLALRLSEATSYGNHGSDVSHRDVAASVAALVYDRLVALEHLEEFHQRRARLGRDVLCDTHMSAHYRTQSLVLGRGS